MATKLEGDVTLDILAFFARERRRIGMDPRFCDDPAFTTDWLNYVEGHPQPMDGETTKNEEGVPRDERQ